MKNYCKYIESYVPPCPKDCPGEGVIGCQKHMDSPSRHPNDLEKKSK